MIHFRSEPLLLASALLGFGGALAFATPAAAAPKGQALVIANGTYGSLPPLPACLLSGHAVAAALRSLGFQVVERDDLSTGGTDAAIGEFSRQLVAAPGAPAVVYSCGYATAFNDRPFMLPVSARIGRPADVLTQGLLVKLLTDVVVRGGASASLVAIDVVPAPDSPPALALDALIQPGLPDSLGLIAVSQGKPPDAPTPLANALISGLKGPEVRSVALATSMQQQLADKPATIVALRPPVAQGYLAGAPASPAQASVATLPPAQPQSAATTVPQTAARQAPKIVVPSEDQMTEADRRMVQSALARLGYYPGQVDAKFGPDTRAAIRRFQHELGAEMTGWLTSAQATRLVSQ